MLLSKIKQKHSTSQNQFMNMFLSKLQNIKEHLKVSRLTYVLHHLLKNRKVHVTSMRMRVSMKIGVHCFCHKLQSSLMYHSTNTCMSIKNTFVFVVFFFSLFLTVKRTEEINVARGHNSNSEGVSFCKAGYYPTMLLFS